MTHVNETNNKELESLNYLDITSTILDKNNQKYKIIKQQYYIDDKENKYEVDNKYVVLRPSKREIEVAKFLGRIYGGKIELIPVVLYPLRHQNTRLYSKW